LKVFWEGHDPTQGYRQGNDVGTQYRSVVLYTSPEQREAVEGSRSAYLTALDDAGFGAITTEIKPAADFYFAEEYHQQYLSDTKNPNGYCGLGGTGLSLYDSSSAENSCQTGLPGVTESGEAGSAR
jgi:peptide-methionine (S)-S-oxide reductase